MPFVLRKKVGKKLKELVGVNIIEPVEEITDGVSPMVTVLKKQNDTIICVDMWENKGLPNH